MKKGILFFLVSVIIIFTCRAEDVTFRITIFDEQPPYPLYIAGSPPFLQFSEGSRIDILREHTAMSWLRNIRIHSMPIKESESRIIDLIEYASVFRMPEDDDWLYILGQGFVYIYDFSPTVNEQFPNFRRYGPLLEVHHNDRVIRFWSGGNETGSLDIRFVAYFKEYEEILLEHVGYGNSIYRIYSLRLEQYTDFVGSWPYFNDSRNAVISVGGEIGELIDIYTISDSIYTRVFREIVRTQFPMEIRWINDNEIRIETNNGHPNLLIRRNDTSFELEYE